MVTGQCLIISKKTNEVLAIIKVVCPMLAMQKFIHTNWLRLGHKDVYVKACI